MRILLVDDNSINLDVLKHMIEGVLESRIDCAASGEQAVSMAALEPYDLIFMDCNMPGLNGYDAATQIKQLPGKFGDTVIVALTADASPEAATRAKGVGMVDVVHKPVRFYDLDQILKTWGT